jgi:hypothetical protein
MTIRRGAGLSGMTRLEKPETPEIRVMMVHGDQAVEKPQWGEDF